MKVLTSPPSPMTWCIVWARSHSPHHSHHIKWTNPKVWPPYVDLQLPFGWMSGSGKGWGRQTGNHVIMGFCMFNAIKLRVLLHRPYPLDRDVDIRRRRSGTATLSITKNQNVRGNNLFRFSSRWSVLEKSSFCLSASSAPLPSHFGCSNARCWGHKELQHAHIFIGTLAT